ncbi:hypothetical protein NPIL_568861, partial [Nephila pilipes]
GGENKTGSEDNCNVDMESTLVKEHEICPLQKMLDITLVKSMQQPVAVTCRMFRVLCCYYVCVSERCRRVL